MLRNDLSQISEKLRQWFKTTLAQRSAAALTEVETLSGSVGTVLVRNFDIAGDGKVARKIQDKFQELYPSSSLFVYSIDDDGAKVQLFAFATAEHVAKGLDCRKWISAVTESVGAGKGGGKDGQATASIPLDNLDDSQTLQVIGEAASKFVSSLNL